MFIRLAKLFLVVSLLAVSGFGNPAGEKSMEKSIKSDIMYASFAEDREQLQHVYYLAESIRQFGGSTKDAPILVLVPDFMGDAAALPAVAGFGHRPGGGSAKPIA